MRTLDHFPGSIIIISNDVDLMRNFPILWHIDNAAIAIFSGNYDDYIEAKNGKYKAIEHELVLVHKAQKANHEALMKEQNREKIAVC